MRKNEPEDMGGCEAEQPAGWYCTRDFHHNGPCATKRLPAAPSVEQDELLLAAKEVLANGHQHDVGGGDVFVGTCEAAERLQRAVDARAASTSANVAQGAEAPTDDALLMMWAKAGHLLQGEWLEQMRDLLAPPPAQTATGDKT